MKEIWRDIKGYEGLYQVSNFGRVKSLDSYIIKSNGVKELRKGRILKPVLQNTGYFTVTLCKNKIHKIFTIHRLIGMTFPDLVEWDEEVKNKPFSEIMIDHKNRIRTDNRVENLKWCTMGGNMNNPLTKQVCSESQKGEKAYWYGVTGTGNPHSKPILQLNKKEEILNQFISAVDAEQKTGISRKAICQCLKGRSKSAGGYIWRYATENPLQ